MANPFQTITVRKPQHSVFDMSFDHKLTCDMGYLVPVNIQEVLPSDKFNIQSEAMIRLQPMIAPIMHKVDIYLHHFFVPNRLNWKNWERFITGGANGTDASIVPFMDRSTFEVEPCSLSDYLGMPIRNVGDLNEQKISALPFAAYQRVWYDYYRDQNLQNVGDSFEEWLPMPDGEQSSGDTTELMNLKRRAWEHDYFTSCLPFAQKGAEVTLPIELTVDFEALNQEVYLRNPGAPADMQKLKDISGNDPSMSGPLYNAGAGSAFIESSTFTERYNLDPNETLRVDVEGTTSDVSTTTSINDLRAAYALQKFLEKNARGGSRYVESLLVHFGVRSSDQRLQRAEYIGGSRSVMAISEVLQTSTSDGSATPQGNMAGHGISMVSGTNTDYFCEEHGFIITILSVRPKTSYHEGLPRIFYKSDKLQFFWADFAQLGEEEVKNKELFYQTGGLPNGNNDTFGYLPRYSEYRYNPSRVSGKFHTDMEYWSLHRSFATPPALNEDFVVCTPSDRIFAVTPAGDSLICHVYHKIFARRPLPKYGDPGGLV